MAVDLEEAYNRVQFKLLMGLLEQYGLSLTLTRCLAVTLQERKVAMRPGNWISTPQQLTMGLPQGSPPSPVLYNSTQRDWRIKYSDTKNVSVDNKSELFRLYKENFSTGQVPEDWYHSYLKPIPKLGKDHRKLNGYRILTMQNTTGKLMEACSGLRKEKCT